VLQLSIICFLGLVCGYAGFLFYRQGKSREFRDYLEGKPGIDGKDKEGSSLIDKIIKVLRPVLPGEQGIAWMSGMLTRAGLDYAPEQIFAVSYASAPLAAAVMFALVNGVDPARAALVSLLFGALVFSIPIIYVSTTAGERLAKADREYLPLLMLMKTLSNTSAGNSFDALAMAAIEDSGGVLAGELSRAFSRVSRGVDKEVALMEAAQRVGLEDFTRFIDAVIEADKKGTHLVNVLEQLIGTAFHNIDILTTKKKGSSDRLLAIPLAGMILPASAIIMIGPGAIAAMQAMTF